MRAKVIHATIDPRRLPVAAEAVRLELGPQLLSHRGARRGYWMADRSTGHVLAVTLWDSDERLVDAAVVDGIERAAVAERIGLRVLSIHSLEVMGAHEGPMTSEPRLHWVRATWVDGLHPDVHGQLPQIFREAVPDQARSRGFCASYWLVDVATGSGLGLSMWEGPAELSASAQHSRRRRRRFEELLGCIVAAVAEYEAIDVVQHDHRPLPAAVAPRDLAGARAGAPIAEAPASSAPASGPPAPALGGVPTGPPGEPAPAVGDGSDGTAAEGPRERLATVVRDLSRRAGLGTTLERPPGALLAVRGDTTSQVVFLMDGRAAVVHRDAVLPMVRGAHFGARSVLQSRAIGRTVLATSPVQVHVFSRTEFAAVSDYLPSLAHDLVEHDLDR